MADLFHAIKNVANNTMDNYGLCDMVIGTVNSISPMKIQISDRIILDKEQILLTQTVTLKTIQCTHTHKGDDPVGLPAPIVVREGLAAGDRVLLLKVQKGQKFIVLSKVVQL